MVLGRGSDSDRKQIVQPRHSAGKPGSKISQAQQQRCTTLKTVSGKPPLCSLWSRTLNEACETPLHRPLDTATAPVSGVVVSPASRRHYATPETQRGHLRIDGRDAAPPLGECFAGNGAPRRVVCGMDVMSGRAGQGPPTLGRSRRCKLPAILSLASFWRGAGSLTRTCSSETGQDEQVLLALLLSVV